MLQSLMKEHPRLDACISQIRIDANSTSQVDAFKMRCGDTTRPNACLYKVRAPSRAFASACMVRHHADNGLRA